MTVRTHLPRYLQFAAVFFALLFGAATAAFAQVTTHYIGGPETPTSPHSFGTPTPPGTQLDASTPYGGLIHASDGNFYGTSYFGGDYGNGAIYKVDGTTGKVTTVWSFGKLPSDPANPIATLIEDQNHNLYGATFYGGIPSTSYNGFYAAGTLFKFDGQTVTTLYSFTGLTDGANPSGALVFGLDGSLYGTTLYGGTSNDEGTIFRCTLTTSGVCDTDVDGLIHVAYRFTGGADGANPLAGLTLASDGSLYGVAYGGGLIPDPDGFGTIFKCTLIGGACATDSNGLLQPAYKFTGLADGMTPYAPLLLASDGNFYGTTRGGATNNQGGIFMFDGVSTVTPIYQFQGGVDGGVPTAGLIEGLDHSLYGTTEFGGSTFTGGTVFKCTLTNGVCGTGTDGLIPKLFMFSGINGAGPFGSVLQTSDGTFWGTTEFGGQYNVGTVFGLVPKAVSTVIVSGGSYIYDGLEHPALATASSTSTSGLTPVVVTYNNSSTVPVNASPLPYAVVATFAGDEYNLPASATATISISQAQSVVHLSDQNFTYDGTPHPATATATGGAVGVLLPVSITYNGLSNVPVSAGTYNVVATFAGDQNNLASSASATLTIARATPVITWTTPAAITYGTALSAAQLNATASVPGTFVYTPAAGTVLAAGAQTLSVTFTPTDAANYAPTLYNVTLTVNLATPVVTWSTPSAITYGTPLSGTQLNATASVAGTFVYSPDAGSILAAGSQTLSVTFTPADTVDYNDVTQTVTLTVNKATPNLTWATPAGITYGTPLSATQLNATAPVAGSFVYAPAAGTVLPAGSQTLSVAFTPADTANYTNATKNVTLTVSRATPTITWPAPAAITYGTALSATQLNATASIAGSFAYTPAAGTVLSAGSQTLSVTFTPTDGTNYTTATATVTLTVNQANPLLTVSGGTFNYDGLPHAAVVSATGISVSLVTVTYNGSSLIPVGAGTYAVLATFAGNTNYAPATANNTIVINPVPLTITANSTSRNYGAPNPAFTATYAGFVHGETPSVLQGTLTFTTPATITSAPGTYPITPGGVVSANYTITFVPGTLTILDVAPTAVDDSISTLPNTPVTIPVLANDTSPAGSLTITAVSTPAHGSAVIAGPTIVYTPNTGFVGNDTFTYTVTDVFGDSSTANVTVIVGGIGRFVVMSSEFTWLRPGAVVASGDIGANLRRQHLHAHGNDFDDGDSDDITVRLAANVTMLQPTSRVVGDTVALDHGTRIYNLVDNFLIDHGATVLGSRISTMQIPFVPMPVFPAVTAGHQNVTVAKNRPQTLGPGSYGKIHVTNGATLTLTGGLYQIDSLDVDQSASVLFSAPVELRIADDLDADSNSNLVTGPGVKASQAVIYIAGGDDNRGNRPNDLFDGDTGGTVVANIGENAVVQANIYAQSGTVWLKSKVQATGSFIGQHVRIGSGVRLTLDSAF